MKGNYRIHILLSLIILLLTIGKCVDCTRFELISNDFTPATSSYSTFFGGSESEDATKIAFDSEGNVIVIGQTESEDFPTTPNPIQSSYAGGAWDSFVAKFDTSGNLVFSTFLGGNNYEHITWVSTDNYDNIVVAGTTQSTDFPVTDDAYLATHAGAHDGFITKISPTGEMIYSTYFGAQQTEWIYGMEFDEENNYMFSGFTLSDGLATSGVYQEDRAGSTDCFAARLSEDGQTLQMLTYFGGLKDDKAWTMDVDSSYNYYITGATFSDDLPVTDDAFQSEPSDLSSIYIAVIDYNGLSLNYSSYFGGSDEEYALGINCDSNRGIIVSGETRSDDFPTTEGAYHRTPEGKTDVFVLRISENRELDFCTRIAGNATDRAWDCRVDSEDNVIIVGRVSSYDFPTANAPQPEKAKQTDAFVSRLSHDGSSLLDSTFVGGDGTDYGEGLDIDTEGNIVISGTTSSDDFPVTPGAFQEECAGSRDVFLCHISFLSEIENTTTSSNSINEYEDSMDWVLISVGVGSLAVVLVIVFIMKVKK